MSTSTDGQIGFGVIFGDGYEFPWDRQPYDGDIDEWWLEEVLKFKSSFRIFSEDGSYVGGQRPPQETIDKYFEERNDFKAAHPKLPVELVNYCYVDYPMWMLATPSSYRRNSRGEAVEFNPSTLRVCEEEKQALLDFCKKHNLEFEKGPAWYLTSYWG